MDDRYTDSGKSRYGNADGSGVYGGYDTSYDWDDETGSDDVPYELQKKRRKRRRHIEKMKRRKKTRKKRMIITAVIAAIVIIILGMFLSSSLFEISEITVNKNTMKTDSELVAESGVKTGDNIFSHSGHSIKKAIMAKNRFITDVDVSRRLPNELIITVKERVPTAALKYEGKYLILDNKGKVICTDKTQLTATRVTGIKVIGYSRNHMPVVKDSSRLKKAIKLINKVNDSGLFFKKLDMSSSLLVHGYITDTLECAGDAGDIGNNLEGIKAVVYDLAQKGTMSGTINVGNDGYATFTPA